MATRTPRRLRICEGMRAEFVAPGAVGNNIAPCASRRAVDTWGAFGRPSHGQRSAPPGAADLTFDKHVRMETKKHSPEDIIAKLRQVEALRSRGERALTLSNRSVSQKSPIGAGGPSSAA